MSKSLVEQLQAAILPPVVRDEPITWWMDRANHLSHLASKAVAKIEELEAEKDAAISELDDMIRTIRER